MGSLRAGIIITLSVWVLTLGSIPLANAERLRGMSGIAPSDFWAAIADLRTLATGALTGNSQGDHVHIRETSLSKSPGGIRVLSRLVQCALSNETKLYLDPVGTETNVVYGRLNFAPEWQRGVPNVAGQERVTACLLALLNKERELPINLYAPLLGSDDTSHPDVENKDATYYGNLFSPDGRAFGCVNTDGAGDTQSLQARICDNQSACTFQNTGECLGQKATAQCQLYHPWRQCHDQTGRAWEHPITVTLDKTLDK